MKLKARATQRRISLTHLFLFWWIYPSSDCLPKNYVLINIIVNLNTFIKNYLPVEAKYSFPKTYHLIILCILFSDNAFLHGYKYDSEDYEEY